MSTGATAAAAATGRVVLLLQGPASWFFSRLAAALRARGARVVRVLLCPGDRLFWRGPGGIAYRGGIEGWRGWLARLIAAEKVSDLVCLGDGRAWHALALAEAEARGVATHVIEQGYLRPHWLTVEPGGTGGRSRLPRDAAAWAARGAGLADPPAPRFAAGFVNYAAMDVAWNLANLLVGWLLWPHYRTHALDRPLTDWAGWALKGLGWPLRRARRARALARIAAHRGPVFLLPLQLETDYQIRLHGPPGGMAGALAAVVAEFAAHAPAAALLVVKRHPLDNGLARWGRRLARAAAAQGVAGRCVDLDGGTLAALLPRCAGVVTVNSTVGLTAIRAGRPVRVLGRAIYDLPGLAHRGPAAGFWQAPAPPDPGLARAVCAALAATVQVPGDFDGPGAGPGAAAMADRILSPVPFAQETRPCSLPIPSS